MKGTDVIIKTMLEHGTNVTFGYPGGVLIPLFDAFLENEGKIKNVLVRHEQCAAHAAEGYARASGKPGVCIATSGPGSSNLVTGIMNAYMDSSPIIAIGGQVTTDLIGNDAFQETDMMGITMPITKHSFQVRSPNDIAPMFMKAYKIATEGRPGPVYIDLPKDTQTGEVTKQIPKEIHIESFNPTLKANIRQIKKAAETIVNAERPLFIAGGGVITSNASKEFKELVELVKAPVATTLIGKGAYDEHEPLSIGMVGMHGRKIANYAMLNCDLMIVIGCRFSDRITGNLKTFAENCKVIHIDIDPAEIGKNVRVDVPIVGDARLAIKDLITAIKKLAKKEKTEWAKRIKELRELCYCNMDRDTTPVSPLKVMYELMKVLKPHDIVCTGVGQHQMFCAHFLQMKNPRTFISSGGAGTMGFGFPASIGAKVAKPNVEVFNVDGDGSFQMTCQELGTIAEEGIKVNPIIMSNHYLGMVRQWLEIFFNKRYSQVHLGKNPDFVKMAEAYGLKGIHVTKPGELREALQKQVKSKKTFIVNVEIEKESNILPMLPPGGHLKDAFGGCMKEQGKFF
jgi:acetolactate synthase-1/2/3 large subunit